MAFLADQQDPNAQSGQQQNQVSTVPQIPSLQGTSGPTAAQSTGTGPVTNTASPGSSLSAPWQNITSYLNANAGQAGKVGDTIAGNLQNQYNSANQAIGQTQQNFGQQIESARVPYNADVAQRAASNPAQFVQNPNDVSAFQKMYNANYAGPQSFSGSSDYTNLQSQVQNAQKQASLANQGTPGLMTLLQQAESQAGKNPSQGVTALDSLLMQESPDNFSRITNAAQPFSGLTNYLSSTQQGLDASAKNAANETAATQQQLQNAYIGPNGIIPTFQNTVNKQLQDLQKQSKNYNNEIADVTGRLSGGQQLTPQELYDVDRTGGLSGFNSIFQNALQFPGMQPGMLSQFYTQPVKGLISPPTVANAMTPQQYADASAINQLVGQNSLEVPAGLIPYSITTDKGNFNDTAAMQAMLDTLSNDQNYLPQMSAGGQSSWLHDMQWLMGALGDVNSPIQPVITPETAPLPPSPTLGGGVPDNPNPPTPTGTTIGGGHFAR